MSKNRASAIVGGAGFAATFWQDLDRAVRERDGTDNDIYRIGTREGSRLIHQFADLIMGAKLVTVREYKTWRKVTIGTHAGLAMLALDIKQALKAEHGSHVQIMLDYIAKEDVFSIASCSQELELVVVTARGLDQCNSYNSYGSICIRAQELGLSLCPPEVALQLCLQHTWEPWLDYFLIGSELFGPKGSHPKYLFNLRTSSDGRQEIQFLEVDYNTNGFPGHTPFIFVKG